MKKFNYKKILFLILVFVSVVAVIFLINKTKPVAPPSPVAFEFVRVLPPTGENEIVFPTTAIIFYFNQMIDLEKTTATITPNRDIEVSLGEDSKSLILKTPYPWGYDINYQISLKVTSSTGTVYEKSDFDFTFKKPTNSEMTN